MEEVALKEVCYENAFTRSYVNAMNVLWFYVVYLFI